MNIKDAIKSINLNTYLDYELEKLIRSYLVDDKSVLDNIFSHKGALGTSSSRIDTAYLLGLIGKKAHRDLHIRLKCSEFISSYTTFIYLKL